MRRNGYNPRLVTGVIAARGTIRILISPSLIFIIYGYIQPFFARRDEIN
jgi:TRAP-type mannitol/chloroaromatic compound transport system permease large subunit